MSYTPTGNPKYRDADSSAQIRAEFALIAQALDQMPVVNGPGSRGFTGGVFNSPTINNGLLTNVQLTQNSRIIGSFLSLGSTSASSPLSAQSPGFWLDTSRRMHMGPGGTVATAMQLDQNRNCVFGDGASALATTATNGFVYMPSCAGAPTGVPTAYTGTVPIAVDTTNNRLYLRIGSTWRYAALT